MDTYTQSLDKVDRAILDGETDGFVRVHVRKGTDEILGATIVAAHAGDMISEFTLAMNGKLGLKTLGAAIHPYPTQAEAIRKTGDLCSRMRLTPLVKKLFDLWLSWRRRYVPASREQAGFNRKPAHAHASPLPRSFRRATGALACLIIESCGINTATGRPILRLDATEQPAPRMSPIRFRIIVTSGPGSEPLDAVRRITNHSTGELGRILAAEFAARGCEVICLQGRSATVPCQPESARVIPFSTNSDLLDLLATLAAEYPAPQAVFHAAALCDYRATSIASTDGRAHSGPKLDSRGGDLQVVLTPALKVISQLRALFPRSLLVGWKYEAEGAPDSLSRKVARQLTENATDFCVLNGPAYGNGFGIFSAERPVRHVEDKTALAVELARQLDLPARRVENQIQLDEIRAAVGAILDQGASLLGELDAATYSRRVPEAYNASIGGHYRHCLDHLEILLNHEEATVDFDARRRDPDIETDPQCARAATERLRQRLGRLSFSDWPGRVRLRCRIAYDGAAASIDSTFAREAMYVVAHAIHHYALIGVMCRLQGIPVPAGFGVAPSTLDYQRRVASTGVEAHACAH